MNFRKTCFHFVKWTEEYNLLPSTSFRYKKKRIFEIALGRVEKSVALSDRNIFVDALIQAHKGSSLQVPYSEPCQTIKRELFAIRVRLTT